jgi:hypothetical protein
MGYRPPRHFRSPVVAASIGPFFPGMGAHYGRVSNIDLTGKSGFGDDRIAQPFAILYDGTLPTSRVAGFLYVLVTPRSRWTTASLLEGVPVDQAPCSVAS